MYETRDRQKRNRPGYWRVATAALLLLVSVRPNIIMAATPNPGELISPELEEFIFHPDQFKTEDIPRGLRPELITKYVQTRISPLTPLAPLRQMEKVVVWYDVLEAGEHLVKLLDKREATPDAVQRSAVVCRVIARLGNPVQLETVRPYAATHLAERADSIPALTELVSVHEALGVEEDPVILRRQIDARLSRAAALAASDAQARQDAQALERLKTVALVRAHQVNGIKNRIVRMPDRAGRLAEEAQVYLGLKHGYGEYLPAWAARRLRRECWAEQPAQQTERMINPVLRLEVVAALRNALPGVATVPKLTDPEKDFIRATALKAIQFFGGELTENELMFLAGKSGSMNPILAL